MTCMQNEHPDKQSHRPSKVQEVVMNTLIRDMSDKWTYCYIHPEYLIAIQDIKSRFGFCWLNRERCLVISGRDLVWDHDAVMDELRDIRLDVLKEVGEFNGRVIVYTRMECKANTSDGHIWYWINVPGSYIQPIAMVLESLQHEGVVTGVEWPKAGLGELS